MGRMGALRRELKFGLKGQTSLFIMLLLVVVGALAAGFAGTAVQSPLGRARAAPAARRSRALAFWWLAGAWWLVPEGASAQGVMDSLANVGVKAAKKHGTAVADRGRSTARRQTPWRRLHYSKYTGL